MYCWYCVCRWYLNTADKWRKVCDWDECESCGIKGELWSPDKG